VQIPEEVGTPTRGGTVKQRKASQVLKLFKRLKEVDINLGSVLWVRGKKEETREIGTRKDPTPHQPKLRLKEEKGRPEVTSMEGDEAQRHPKTMEISLKNDITSPKTS